MIYVKYVTDSLYEKTYQNSTQSSNWSGRLAKCRLAVISHAAHNSWRGTQLQTCKHGHLWCLQLGLKSGIYACLVGSSCTHQASFDNTCICINSQDRSLWRYSPALYSNYTTLHATYTGWHLIIDQDGDGECHNKYHAVKGQWEVCTESYMHTGDHSGYSIQ